MRIPTKKTQKKRALVPCSPSHFSSRLDTFLSYSCRFESADISVSLLNYGLGAPLWQLCGFLPWPEPGTRTLVDPLPSVGTYLPSRVVVVSPPPDPRTVRFFFFFASPSPPQSSLSQRTNNSTPCRLHRGFVKELKTGRASYPPAAIRHGLGLVKRCCLFLSGLRC